MTENASMKDIIEALDEVCYKTVGIHYVPIQSLDIYETIEAPPKAVKTLSKLRAFADIKPQPNLDSIVSDIIILSMNWLEAECPMRIFQIILLKILFLL